jgi:hypothetical protein
MMQHPELADLVHHYYNLAPKVVAGLDAHPDADSIYSHLREKFIEPGLRHVLADRPEHALKTYADMLKFVGPIADSAAGDLLGAGGHAVSNMFKGL